MRLVNSEKTVCNLVYSVLQSLTCLKARHVGCFNLDFLASLWVATSASCTVLNRKSAETNQRNLVAIFE